jgi:hypothetical protein
LAPAPTAPDHPAGLLIRPGGCMHVADLFGLNARITIICCDAKILLDIRFPAPTIRFVHRTN